MKTHPLLAAIALTASLLLAGSAGASDKCNSTFPVDIDGIHHEMEFKNGDFVLNRLDGNKKHIRVYPISAQEKVLNDPKYKLIKQDQERKVAEMRKGLPMSPNPCDGVFGFSIDNSKGTGQYTQITVLSNKASAQSMVHPPIAVPSPFPKAPAPLNK